MSHERKTFKLSPEDLAIVLEIDDEEGLYMVCKPCRYYGKQCARNKGGKYANSVKDDVGLVTTREGRPFECGEWSKWGQHKASKLHKKCCKRFFDPDKVWPTDGEVCSSVKKFFKPVKKNNSGNVSSSEPPRKKMKFLKPLPYWRRVCNGIIPTMQLINKPYRGSDFRRNKEQQEGLAVTHKYLNPSNADGYELGIIPGSSTWTLFSKGCTATENW